MESLAGRVPIEATDVLSLVHWVRGHAIDLVVIGPETLPRRGSRTRFGTRRFPCSVGA
jgi:hypothetical protein